MTRRLTEYETGEARRVFGDALDTGAVRVIERVRWLSSHQAVSLGPVICFGRSLSTATSLVDMAWLVHELTHQWQYQRRGWRYVPAALRALSRGVAAYEYTLTADARWKDYSVEQQAEIARDYYLALRRGEDASAWLAVLPFRVRTA